METKFIALALLSLLVLSCGNNRSSTESKIPPNTKRTIIFGDSTSTITIERKAEIINDTMEVGLQKDRL